MRLVRVVTSVRSSCEMAMRIFFEQIVDREIGVAHLDGRIEQARRANHLVDVHTARFGEFILVGGWR